MLARIIVIVALLAATPALALDIWLAGDPHVCNTGIPAASRPWCDRYKGIKSLQRGIEQSKAITDWEIGIVVGDFGMTNTTAEGVEIAKQMNDGLGSDRASLYTLAGNHDATCGDGMLWFRKYVDPLGEFPATSGVNPANFPYTPNLSGGGSWANYFLDVGNIRFVMMSDRNWTSTPIGRCNTEQGWPTGSVAGSVYQWLANIIAENEAREEPRILIFAHHHMLRDTTAGSCDWCGRASFQVGLPNWKDQPGAFDYHGLNGFVDSGGERFEGQSTKGAGNLYYIDSTPVTDEFETLLSGCGSCALWIGGHTHLVSPDHELFGMGPVAEKYGMAHANVAALTSYWSGFQSMSRILEIEDGSDVATLRYVLHTASGGVLHSRVDTIDLKRAFVAP